jgi:Class II flagellar assembly regulator
MYVTQKASAQAINGSASAPTRATSTARFSLDTNGPQRASSAQSAAPAGAMDALLTVQAAGDPLERRKRALRRGNDLLDELDQLKVALLSGRIPPAVLLKIRHQLAERRELVDDPRLDDILAHIELRAEVELAKLARR